MCTSVLGAEDVANRSAETKYGLGRHIWTVDPGSALIQLRVCYRPFSCGGGITNSLPQVLYSVVLSYNFGLNVVKIAFILFYLRIFSSTALKTVCKWVLGYVLLWTVVQALILAFACMPISVLVSDMQGRCLRTYPVWLTSSIMSTVTDFTIFALPLPSVLKLKLRTKQKVITAFMFSLGFL